VLRKNKEVNLMNRDTLMFGTQVADDKSPKEILQEVYDALEEKNYNAIDQIVGYLISGDPSYITSHNNARNLIRKIDRDDLIETIVRNFLDMD
jgi:uncharacterized protein (UPF0297 family)